ncbi:MAG TPA: hypothetical protein VF618_12090 [Thermoanaerobaculia bacterium]
MIPDQAWEVVPPNLPTDVRPWVLRFAEQAELGPRETRSYAWSMHLLGRLNDQAITTAITGVLTTEQGPRQVEITDVTAGFIPFERLVHNPKRSLRGARMELAVPTADSDGRSFTFGIVIGITPPEETDERRAGEDVVPSQVVSIDGFPVVVEYRRIDYTAPPNPVGATATCFAKPRANKRFFGPTWSAGVVIARHSLKKLGFSTGIAVPMTSGTSYAVVDIDSSTTIDAAILDCGTMPPHARPLTIAAAVASGANVNVRTVTSNFSAQVLRINDHPSYYGNLIAHRLFLDTVGVKGDSGSLVVRSPHGDSAGLYMGNTGGAVPEGLVQSMRQISNYFEVDLFD